MVKITFQMMKINMSTLSVMVVTIMMKQLIFTLLIGKVMLGILEMFMSVLLLVLTEMKEVKNSLLKIT
jgi:hypothetical protein